MSDYFLQSCPKSGLLASLHLLGKRLQMLQRHRQGKSQDNCHCLDRPQYILENKFIIELFDRFEV